VTLASGTKLGPYEITGAIGAGGMGEVYRARDTRLGRDVAIKILPQHLTAKANVKQRFEREARAISSLQHPNICTLYDVGHQDGTDFLVMEYLEGETLADRVAKGPLAPEQVLKIGIEICEGLEKAHRTGVVHRDLKPGNIMLTKTGTKLLDFGLAKPREAAPAASLTAMPTSSRAMEAAKPVTAEGTIVGTFQYMSPEQLEGQEADARSDIFSFGAVLFEMATGERAFEGKSQTSVIAAILEREPPPISQLQPMSPPALDRAVKICLAKDPDERFQSAHDVKLQLEWIRDAGSQAGIPAPVVKHRKNRERVAWASAALLAVVAALLAYNFIARAPKPAPAVVSEISPPASTNFAFGGDAAGPAVISPDGRRVAFSAIGSDGKQLLWVRPLDSATAQPLEGTDGATFPFWSPDGRSLGFFASGKLNRIDAFGSPPLAIAEASTGRGGSWGSDGTILFTPDTNNAIYRVPVSGGRPQAVTELNASRQEMSHRWPQFLPDGSHFLFYAHCNDPQNDATYAASLDGGEPKLIVHGDSNALYAPPGYLLFVREGTLMAQRFDVGSLRLTGDPMPLAEPAEVNAIVWRGIFSLSQNGILAYGVGSAGLYRMLWYDRSGKQTAETGAPGDYHDPRISPDGRKLAYNMIAPGTSNWTIAVSDLESGVSMRLTFSSSIDRAAAWSPDGKTIAFASNRSGKFHLYQKAADGTGTASPLVVDDALEMSPSWSADGRYLVFERLATAPGSHTEIWALSLSGDRKPFPVVQTQEDVFQPSLSSDDRWLAYTSLGPGQREIYVVPFNRGGGKWLVSPGGGLYPHWRHDGKELFYLSPDNKIMSAEISESGSGIVVGQVAPMFLANTEGSTVGWTYDVSADGKEFVVVTQGAQPAAAPLTLVTNWPALLKK
jgi:serine/threonine protein kinase